MFAPTSERRGMQEHMFLPPGMGGGRREYDFDPTKMGPSGMNRSSALTKSVRSPPRTRPTRRTPAHFRGPSPLRSSRRSSLGSRDRELGGSRTERRQERKAALKPKPKRKASFWDSVRALYPTVDDVEEAGLQESVDDLFLRTRPHFPLAVHNAPRPRTEPPASPPASPPAQRGDPTSLDANFQDLKELESKVDEKKDKKKENEDGNGNTFLYQKRAPVTRFGRRGSATDQAQKKPATPRQAHFPSRAQAQAQRNNRPPSTPQPRPTQQPSDPRQSIEVAPGQWMEVRGAEETLLAVQAGTAAFVPCMCCGTTLQCVPDADLVICPDCRVMSVVPCEEGTSRVGGIGLGLRA